MGLPFSHLQRGGVETALSYVERGLEIASQIGHQVAEGFAAIVQGEVAMGQGNYAGTRSARRHGIGQGGPFGLRTGGEGDSLPNRG
jgi:hypothetical protein